MIRWDDKYSTGVDQIDHQHKWIFDFANDLEKQLKDNSRKTDIDHVLKSLKHYSEIHFQYEEHCMHKWKCPVANKNKSAHQQFLFAYENFMERYNREGHSEQLAWKIHDMVERWIEGHICEIDVHLRACTKAS